MFEDRVKLEIRDTLQEKAMKNIQFLQKDPRQLLLDSPSGPCEVSLKDFPKRTCTSRHQSNTLFHFLDAPPNHDLQQVFLNDCLVFQLKQHGPKIKCMNFE